MCHSKSLVYRQVPQQHTHTHNTTTLCTLHTVHCTLYTGMFGRVAIKSDATAAFGMVHRLGLGQKSREKEFVVDSGASVHMVSKKDLNSAELETMRISRNPTTVMTANGEVQTREEATVCVKQLDLFVKVVLLEETPAVLSLVKLCEDRGYTYHWISGQKTHLIKNGKRIDCNISNYVPFVFLGLSTSSSSTTPSPTSSSSSSQDSSNHGDRKQILKWGIRRSTKR